MNNDPNRKVLVLGHDTRSFLTVVRSLGRAGIKVHVGWCPPDVPARFSRYINKYHDIPIPISTDNEFWKMQLKNLLRKEQFDLVIPCHDPCIIPLQTNRYYFNDIGNIYLLNTKSYDVTSNKGESYSLARSLGIPIPKQLRISAPFIVHQILSEISFPIVLKPLRSFVEKDLLHRKNVTKVFDADGLTNVLSNLTDGEEILVQENFDGSGVGVEILCDKGEILTAFQHLRIHEPLLGGGSSYRKSVPLDSGLFAATERLMHAMTYTGVAMVEYRMNMDTKEWVFLEVNGRFWGSLPLAVSAGVDFPLYLYQLLVENKKSFPRTYATNLYCRNLINDIEWMRQTYITRKSAPFFRLAFLRKMVFEALRNILNHKERSDTFIIDDLRPAIIELSKWLKAKLMSFLRKLQLKIYSSYPIRANMRRRLLSRLKAESHILFVCYGNIIRSPFAQGYAKTLLPNRVRVFSAGYYAKEGRPSPDSAIEVAKEFGVDLSNHSSCILTKDCVNSAQLIFVFDKYNHEFITKTYPTAKKRVFFLGTVLKRGPMIIHDPYDHDSNDILVTYRKIAESLSFLRHQFKPDA